MRIRHDTALPSFSPVFRNTMTRVAKPDGTVGHPAYQTVRNWATASTPYAGLITRGPGDCQ